MKLPSAEWQERAGMAELLEALHAHDGQTRYVGGCVRDTLLGLPVSDVDLATRIPPDDVLTRLAESGMKAVPTGIAHGTVTAVLPAGPVEVTTLRRDVSTDGRRATVAYTEDWQEDAARRDFTINALSADPHTGEIFDYFGGLTDLQARRVRFIGDARSRIAEDHLRILRFFRFHARFGAGEADVHAVEACSARSNDLMALSRERIADELLKMLQLHEPSSAFHIMVDHNILRPVLPEIEMAGIERLRQLIASEAQAGIPGNPIRRLAALLPADPSTAGAVAARLRLSKAGAKRLVSAAAYTSEGEADPEVSAYNIGRDEAIDRLLLQGDVRAASLKEWKRPVLQIRGGELISMGLVPGPMVAETLRAIETEWASNGFPPALDRQQAIARRFVAQAIRASQ